MVAGDDRKIGGAAGGTGLIRPVKATRSASPARDAASDADDERRRDRRLPAQTGSGPEALHDRSGGEPSAAAGARAHGDADQDFAGGGPRDGLVAGQRGGDDVRVPDPDHPASALDQRAATVEVLQALARRREAAMPRRRVQGETFGRNARSLPAGAAADEPSRLRPVDGTSERDRSPAPVDRSSGEAPTRPLDARDRQEG